MKRFLQGQPLRGAYYEPAEKQIIEILYDILFAPLVALLQPTETRVVLNALRDPLEEAIKSGRVHYDNGVFTGKFSAAISGRLKALGATFNKRTGQFKLEPAKVPDNIRVQSALAVANAKALHEAIVRKLNEVQANLEALLKPRGITAQKAVSAIASDFQKASRGLMVMPELSAEGRKRLQADYNDNMKLSIRGFAEEEVQALRKTVEANAMTGYRAKSLIQGIQERYDVTKNKAKFLARQETGLMVSKFRRERFADAGVKRYRWSATRDVRTRHDHKDLDGKEFAYNDPPIVDKNTGRRANPGEDFNCRCLDIPILGA